MRKTPDMDNELEALEGLNERRQKLMEQMEPLMQTFTDTRSLDVYKRQAMVKVTLYSPQGDRVFVYRFLRFSWG